MSHLIFCMKQKLASILRSENERTKITKRSAKYLVKNFLNYVGPVSCHTSLKLNDKSQKKKKNGQNWSI